MEGADQALATEDAGQGNKLARAPNDESTSLQKDRKVVLQFFGHKCPLCPLTFPTITALLRHRQSHEEKLLPHVCTACKSKFRRFEDLEAHQTWHLLLLRVINERISYNSSPDSNQIDHAYTQSLDSINAPTPSAEVMKSFDLKDGKFVCRVCAGTVDSKDEVVVHFQEHVLLDLVAQRAKSSSVKKTGAYPCSFCSITFRVDRYRAIHEEHHFVKDLNGRKCFMCNKTFRTRKHLTNHYLLHGRRQYFSCNACGARFLHNADLDVHKRVHAAIRLHSCPTCSASFFRRSSLLAHVPGCQGSAKAVTETDGKRLATPVTITSFELLPKTVTTSGCPRLTNAVTTTDGQRLTKAVTTTDCQRFPKAVTTTDCQRLTKAETESSPCSILKCDECHKTFNKRFQLEDHRQKHAGVKSHLCYTCGKTFHSGRALSSHIYGKKLKPDCWEHIKFEKSVPAGLWKSPGSQLGQNGGSSKEEASNLTPSSVAGVMGSDRFVDVQMITHPLDPTSTEPRQESALLATGGDPSAAGFTQAGGYEEADHNSVQDAPGTSVQDGMIVQEARDASVQDGMILQEARDTSVPDGMIVQEARDTSVQGGMIVQEARDTSVQDGMIVQEARDTSVQDGMILQEARDTSVQDGMILQEARDTSVQDGMILQEGD